MEWEYFLIYLQGNVGENENRMNELGEKRWELVSVSDGRAYFKRPVEAIYYTSKEAADAAGK